jgi:DNA (cytosine-5)-methyltransferase 1
MQELCKKNVKKLQKRFFPYICCMEKLRHGSLFSGIGGFDLAAEWMGWDNVFHCEWNEFGQKVLKHYWPQAESFSDITKTDFTKYYGTVDIITGGFPCQPYSTAGKRKGKEDERHLWPEMCRAIREISPRFVVGENVRGLLNWNGGLVFDEVCAELESLGYQVAPVIIPAAALGAPHGRDRIWFVANASDNGNNRRSSKVQTKSKNKILQKRNDIQQPGQSTTIRQKVESPSYWEQFPTKSAFCSGNDGFPSELDGVTFSKWRNESIKAYGNAIVPQVAFQIFKAIEKTLYL